MKRHTAILGGIVALLAALAIGFFIGRWTGRPSAGPADVGSGAATQRVYTCSMHPQVRLDKPGKCPICEMPLIPASAAQSPGGAPPALTLSDQALAMASVETTLVAYRELSHHLRAVGKIQYNEPSLATVTARVDGYAEKLFVNVTGVNIKAGDHLVEVYSPDLMIAQHELLIAVRDGASGPLVESSKVKLRNWGLTEKQIDDLITSRKIGDRVTLYSPITGTVIEKMIVENSAFKAGEALYRIANLDTVWVYLDIYEFDLAWVRYGQEVELTTESYPGQVFTGMVTFVEPVLNEETRTIRVPVHVENKRHALKPGMYVSAIVKATLGPDGEAAPTGIEGKFTCPMHPQVVKDDVGLCPMCNMPLEQIPSGGVHEAPTQAPADRYACPMKCEGDKTYDGPGNCPVCHMNLDEIDPPAPPDKTKQEGLLAVPVSAVLDSGTRKIVYVEKGRGTFESREVVLGPRSGGYFPVLKGLAEGERVVTRGGFLIDSQFQITGHPSLYYPGGLHATVGHQHGGTGDTPDTETPTRQPAVEEPTVPPAGGHKH
ncbi:MAG: efflux RND transporter periplasmic adaptor subunit [Planctomycetota bacterium]|nr:efflux RND transporter periplasmic adaptor subunit [Planctomycetota bacterium]